VCVSLGFSMCVATQKQHMSNTLGSCSDTHTTRHFTPPPPLFSVSLTFQHVLIQGHPPPPPVHPPYTPTPHTHTHPRHLNAPFSPPHTQTERETKHDAGTYARGGEGGQEGGGGKGGGREGFTGSVALSLGSGFPAPHTLARPPNVELCLAAVT
jgi:hypothetical protein